MSEREGAGPLRLCHSEVAAFCFFFFFFFSFVCVRACVGDPAFLQNRLISAKLL